MSALPPTLDFAAAEEEICAKWKEEDTFLTQDKLSLDRGDEVRLKFSKKKFCIFYFRNVHHDNILPTSFFIVNQFAGVYVL